MAAKKTNSKPLSASAIPSPPAVGAPRPPTGFTSLTKAQTKAKSAFTEEQLNEAPAVATELGAWSSYTSDLGKAAPALAPLTQGLRLAATWKLEADRADAWAAYAHAQKLLAEQAIAPQIAKLKVEFKHAVTNDAALAEDHPATAQFLGAQSAAAKRGLATKRAKKNAAKGAKS